MSLFFLLPGPNGSFALSAGSITDTDSSPVTVKIRFNTDGSVDKYISTYSPYNAAEYWTREPIAGIGTGKYVRVATINSGAFTTEAASAGTWVEITTAREWLVTDTACDADFELGRDGSTAEVLANIVLTATVL